MSYSFNEIEAKWQAYWAEHQTFSARDDHDAPKYYVLDMFPYPSGAGLHVGHPLGYIASDIVTRYKRHLGYNVLHPQGYDSFGLPAEQYAIQTGQHPAVTTEENIKRYRQQLDQIGFSFDWNREVRTSDPSYYRWTQWIFSELFESWYNLESDRAEPISTLIKRFEETGNAEIQAVYAEDTPSFSALEWKEMSEAEQGKILLNYRLTYLAETEVNWCPKLGTVLANDEVVNGVSERGGYPVERKKMRQWSMRMGAYAERLLHDLEGLDWSEPLKEMQRNWIGKSTGAQVSFALEDHQDQIEVFTTRPDTLFGVTFMTLAPEHELVSQITTEEQRAEVTAYMEATARRSERDRMTDVKTISGVFTGAYALHPFTQERVPVWIGDYVLAGYGTGAVMAVPAGDQRDYLFAKHFGIPIKNIFEGADISTEAFADKEGVKLCDSDFLNGLNFKEATASVIEALEKRGAGRGKINYRLRDAVFSRQRYWGEPFPIYYRGETPILIDVEHLPLCLPEVEKYLPTPDGAPPLGNAEVWAWDTENHTVVANELIDHERVFPLELNTMPGWAGSSWYFNRYMDPQNQTEFASRDRLDYWREVDLYLGGSEHATGHLLYARFWQKFLFDRGYVPVQEFARKLVNQGMILGTSAFIYRRPGTHEFVSFDRCDRKESGFVCERETGVRLEPIHVDVNFVNASEELDLDRLRAWRSDFETAQFIGDTERFIVGREVEKMSKSKYNVVNPDDICERYGADTLRMYEMFLGPLEQAKPWNTSGISGVHGFLKKVWRLAHQGDNDGFLVSDEAPSPTALKALHKTIKKVTEDIEQFSFNTAVSAFMICVNELSSEKVNQRAIIEPLVVLLSPFAPHIAEELWSRLGHQESISTAPYPIFEAKHLVESTKVYPISFKGKTRFTLEFSVDTDRDEITRIVLEDPRTISQLNGADVKKVIVVPGKIVNIVF